MKIAYVCYHPFFARWGNAGDSVRTREFIHELEQLGHDVVPILAGELHGEASQVATGITVRASKLRRFKSAAHRVVPSIWWETLRDARLLREQMRRRQKTDVLLKHTNPDVVFEQGHYLSFGALRLAQNLNVPLFLDVQAPFVEERCRSGRSTLLRDWALKRELKAARQADLVMVVSTALRDYYSSRGVPEEKLVVLSCGANGRMFQSCEASRDKKRAELGFSREALVFGFVGSFFRWHGTDTLLAAFADVARDEPNARLLLIGSGETYDRDRELSKALGLEKTITFAGMIPYEQMPEYIDAMDVGISPNSHWYGSPVKIFEYGIMGKAVIAPDLQPIREVVEDRRTALLVVPGNETHLAQAMLKLARGPTYRRQLAEAFEAKTRQRYTWRVIAERISELLLRLASGNPQISCMPYIE